MSLRIEAQELDISRVAEGKDPVVSSVAYITPTPDRRKMAIVNKRQDGRQMAYLFVFDAKNPVADIYGIRPESLIAVSDSGCLLIDDSDDSDDFAMRRIGKVSPSYRPVPLQFHEGKELKIVRFSMKL